MEYSYGNKKGKSAKAGSGKRSSAMGKASRVSVKHEDIEGVKPFPKGMARVSPRSGSAK